MSLGKLGKKLQRDLRANPKKGVLLVLMLCGAGYFWGPIIKRWTAGQSVKGTAGKSTTVILDDPMPAAGANAKAKLPSWEKLQELIQKDRFTKPAELKAELRDPFSIADLLIETQRSIQQEESARNAQQEPAAKPQDPAKLNLHVSSVVIGPRGRSAAIAGGVYHVGDVLTFGENEKTQKPLNLTVRTIEAWGVVLECGGSELKLFVPQPQLQNRDRIVRGAPRVQESITTIGP